MSDSDRRDFLKKSAAAAAALGISCTASAEESALASEAVAGRADEGTSQSQEAETSQDTPTATAETLRAVGAAVLPVSDLGDEGVDRVVTEFEAWIEGFEPVAELPHGYLSRGLAEIRYGPPHPGPRWASQVEALELEAQKRHRSSFAELTVGQRRALIEGQLDRDEIGRLPGPGQARHVAIGLLAFFYDSAEATDLCYRASIGRYRCRGLSTLGREPPPLAGGREPRSREAGSQPSREDQRRRTPGRSAGGQAPATSAAPDTPAAATLAEHEGGD